MIKIARANDRQHLVGVVEPAETIKHAPCFGNSEELTPELENHVRNYFGLEAPSFRRSMNLAVCTPRIT